MKRYLQSSLVVVFLLFTTSILIAQPTINSFSPASGPVGTSVTILGTNFNATPANNIVYFGATRATVNNASSTQLVVTVPAGATYQPISVLSNGLLGYSKAPFTVTFPVQAGISSSSLATPLQFTGDGGTIVFGDLDGDGLPDMVINVASLNIISVYRNTSSVQGSISFANKIDFTTGSGPQKITIGDIDSDGKLDIVVPNSTSNTISVLRNTSSSVGSVAFANKVDFSTGPNPNSVSITDFDKDGKADIVATNQHLGAAAGTNTVSVLRNTGSGSGVVTFATKEDFVIGAAPGSASTADIDGDGLEDIIAINNSGGGFAVILNTSTGSGDISFGARNGFSGGNYDLAVGDINGDGKADVVATGPGSDLLSTHMNTSIVGSVTFDRVDFTTSDRPNGVSIGDIDGDGKVDIAIACGFTGGRLTVFRNVSPLGSIDLENRIDFAEVTKSNSAYIGDLDADGKSDIAMTADEILVYRNTAIDLTNFSFDEPSETITVNKGTSQTLNNALSLTSASTVNLDIHVSLGDTVSFAKANLADWTQPANQDQVTSMVWITRADFQGIFNISQESSYTSNSPVLTLWDSLPSSRSNGQTKTWVDANNGNPPSMVGNTYSFVTQETTPRKFDVAWKSWSIASEGGGFSYDRIEVPTYVDITNPQISTSTDVNIPITIDATNLEAGTYTFDLIATDGSETATRTITVDVLNTSMEVAYYPLNGNTQDFSSNNLNGTANGAVTTSDRFGNPNAAYKFDGINDFITVSDNDLLDFGTSDFTLSAWVKTSNSSNLQRIISKGSYLASNGYMMRTTPLGKAFFEINGIPLVSSNAIIADGEWHMVSVVLDRDNSAKIFVDGVLNNATLINTTSNDVSNDTPLSFGIHGTSSEPLDGSLDEIHLFNYALLDNEIADIYYAEIGLEHWFLEGGDENDIVGNLTATQNGIITPTPDRFGNSNAAFFFDGANFSYDANTSVGGSSQFSVSSWFYPDFQNGFGTIISENNIGGQGVFYIDVNQDNIGLVTYTDGTTTNEIFTSDASVKPFQWNHVAVTFSSGNAKIYLNGVEKASASLASPVFDGTSTLNIGSGTPFNGNLDDIRIYHYPLSQENVLDLYYENGWTGVSSEFLVGQYNFSGNTFDNSGNGNDGTIVGNPVYVQDRFGNANSALDFDGVDDIVQVFHDGSMGSVEDWTVNVWVNYTEQQNGFEMILWDNGFSYDIVTQNYEGLLEQLAFHYNLDGSTFPTVVSDPYYIPFGVWTMLTIRGFNNGDGVDLFINANHAGNFDISGRIQSIGSLVEIGGRSGNGEYFDGTIDDVSIYTTWLDENDIKSLYSSGNYQGPTDLIANWPLGLSVGGSDISGFGQDLVFTDNSTGQDRFKLPDESIGFNGASTNLARNDMNHPQGELVEFSYSLWEYHTVSGGMALLDLGGGESQILLDADVDDIQYSSNANFPTFIGTDGTNRPLKGRWNHIVVTGEKTGADGFIKIYVNGVLTADEQYYWIFNGNDLFLGLKQDFFNPFTGRLDDIRIYNYAIDETEVLDLFNEGIDSEIPIAWLEPSLATPEDEVTIYYNAERGNKALMGADRAYIHVGAVIGNDPVYEWGDYVLDTTWFSGVKDNGIGEMTLDSGNTWQYTLSPSARAALGVPADDLMQRLGMIFRSPDATVFGVGTPSEYGDFPGGRVEDGTYWNAGDIYLNLVNPSPLELDSLSLVALYNATNGSSWFDASNWLAGPVDTWYGVTVANGRVTEVDLYDNNLVGSIPPEIGNLSALVNLYLAVNDLSGSSIPAEINQLTSLVELNLFSTGIGGDIPDLSDLTNLTLLSLSDNQLTGTIPTTIGSLTNLTDLYLWGNSLTGTIPASLGNLSNMDWLNLAQNDLSGTIPSTLGNLSVMTFFSITSNNISGQIPASFSNLTSLDVLALGGNNLSGQIPAYLGVNVFLTELYLWDNDFIGKIPSSLGNMTGLTELWLSNNFLIGPIPAELNNLTELNSLILGGNQLSDTIPDLSNLDSLVDFSVFENNLTGDVPDYFNQIPLLEVFSVRDNNFENMVDLSGLGNLTDVRMEGNRFTFEDILPNIGTATNGEIYSPQQNAGKVKFIKVSQGSDYTINLGFDLSVTGNSYKWFRDGVEIGITTVPSRTITNFQAAQTWLVEITNTSAPDLTLTTSNINLEISNLCISGATDNVDTRIDRVIFADLDYTSSVVGDGLCASYSNFTDQSATVAVGQTVDIGFQIGTCGSLLDRGVKMYVDWDQDGSFDESTEFVGQGGILTSDDPDGFLFFTEDFYTIPDVPNGNYTLRVVAQETSDISTITGCGTYEWGETEDYTIQVIDTQSDLIVNADDISPETMFDSNTPLSSTDQITITLSVTNIGQYASIGSTNGIGIYASDDDIWDTGDVLIEMVTLNSIDAASLTTLEPISISPPAIEGSFYGIVVVNPLEEIPETDYDNNAIVSDPIYVSAPADSEDPVVTLVSPPSTYTKGTGGVTIVATVTDNMGIEGVVLAYGKRSEITDDFDQSQYTVISPEEVSAGRYEHVLTDSDFDEVGVQYYFGATDASGNVGLSSPLPAKISVEFPDGSINLSDVSAVSNASDPQETDYRIFSVPVLNATINSVLGFTSADKTAWRVWQFNGNSNSELSSTSSGLSVGSGYWLIYLNSAGIDLNFGGQAVDASNSNPYIMNLSSGINLIGNPYNFPISWQEVIDYNINASIINDGDVSGLTFYRGGFNSAGNGTLGVTEGAFVQSNEPVALQIPPSTSTLARTGNNMRTYPKALDDESWEVGINLSNAVTFYNVASIGMNPEASDGNDKYDQQAMPYLFNYLEFNSNNDQLTDRISQEIVETTDSHVWEYEATTSFEPSAAILSWDNSYFGDNDRQLYLYDVAEERIINMREQQEYHFDLKGKRRFRIAYGSQEFIESNLQPNRFTLGHAYPNPFADVTRIPFSLSNESSEYKVKMTIYNSVGELVEVLTDESYQPGFYAADWDGTNTLGQQVSEGIYIYKLSISHEEGSENLTGKLIYGK